jgi:hypothetical protein
MSWFRIPESILAQMTIHVAHECTRAVQAMNQAYQVGSE